MASVKKHYVLIGIGVAALVAVTIVVIGAGPGGDGSTAAGDAPATTQPLPSGHPPVNGKGAGDTAATPGDPAVKRSIAQLKAAVKSHPQDADRLLELGDALFMGRQYGAAGRAFQSVLRLRPDNAAATVRLAMVWHADGDSSRAIAKLEDVIAATPQDQEAHYSLAIVYFSQGDAARAKTEWQTAADLDPSSLIGRRSKSFVDLLEGKQTNTPSAGGQ